MSRIGKLPITVPAGVTVTVDENNLVTVKGPKGTLSQQVNPDITINNGDYDAMKTFASEMQGKTHEGKVVKVTGISTRSNFGAKASIMESDGGSQKIGATYKLTGVDAIDGYPADDAVVELTGVVKVDDNGISCYIEVAPDNLKTVG